MNSPQEVAAIGRFQVVDVLFKGATGVVYLARDEAGRLVSIKTLSRSYASDPLAMGRLRSEAKALEKLRHPNVVALLEVDTDAAVGLYLVMDHAPGRTLRAVLDEEGFLDPEDAGVVAQQICEALAAAHEEDIIHREITPDNIIIGEDYTVTVADFGIAKLTSTSGLTLPGVIPGSPEYMSPEQASGIGHLDSSSDIYACGVVLYEMLTGSVPFHGTSRLATMQMQMFNEPEPPRQRSPHVPEDLQEIVLRALRKDPGDRFASAAAMAKELDIWLRHVEAHPLPKVPRPPRPPKAPRPPTLEGFEPKPGDTLSLGLQSLTFVEAPDPGASPGALAPFGDHSYVFRLSTGMRDQALKVFLRDELRVPELAGLAGNLWAAAGLQGLKALDRTVLTPEDHGELLRGQPALRYAVLMPWIEGPRWAEVVKGRRALTREQCSTLGKALLELLAALEVMGVAHCALSSTNLLLPLLAESPVPGSSPIELVDLEQMCAPAVPSPVHSPSETPGYGRPPSEGAAWGPAADRRAGGLLVAEILAWWHPEVVEAAYGPSVFDPGEIGGEGPRFQAVHKALEGDWGAEAARLFRACWTSPADSGCPGFQEWWEALHPPAPAPPRPAPKPPRAVKAAPPAPESEPEPVLAPEPEPILESLLAPEPEPVLEPLLAPEPEPVLAAEPAPEPVLAPEPAPEPEPAMAPEPAPRPGPAATRKPGPRPAPMRGPRAPVPGPEPEVAREPEPPALPEAAVEPVPPATPEPGPAPSSAARPRRRFKLRPEPGVGSLHDEEEEEEEEEPPPEPEPPRPGRVEEEPEDSGEASPGTGPSIKVVIEPPNQGRAATTEEIDVEGSLQYRTPITFVSVRVNDRPVRLSPEEFSQITRTGRFKVRVPLNVGSNVIEVVARGKGGADGKATRTVTRMAETWESGQAAPKPPAPRAAARPEPAEEAAAGPGGLAMLLVLLSVLPLLGLGAPLLLWGMAPTEAGKKRSSLLLLAALAAVLALASTAIVGRSYLPWP